MPRSLPLALKEHFDSLISGEAVAMNDPAGLLCLVALSCVGVKEVGGDNRGPMVELFQSVVSSPKGQSWCADFVQSCIAYVEAVKGVQSPLTDADFVLKLWDDNRAYHAVTPPRRGDLILWRFGDTIQGHCGIVLGGDSLRYQTVEGNTSDSTGIDRNGDGVYPKNRAKGGSSTFRELGFLRAFP